MIAKRFILALIATSSSEWRAVSGLDLFNKLWQAALNATGAMESTSGLSAEGYEKFLSNKFYELKKKPAADSVAKVKQGMGLTTSVVIFMSADDAGAVQQRYLQEMVDEGLVTVLLDLLNQCEESMSSVVEAKDGSMPLYDSNTIHMVKGVPMEGYLRDPTPWIDILIGLVDPDMRVGKRKMYDTKMQIARQVGPLIKCLANDMKREFFQDKRLWHKAFLPFVNLLNLLIGGPSDWGANVDKDFIPILLQYEGLLPMLVRCIFWADQRPDIAEESKLTLDNKSEEKMAWTAYFAGNALIDILLFHEIDEDATPTHVYYRDDDGVIAQISKTVIVNEEYNQLSNITFGVGILGILTGNNKDNTVMRRKDFLHDDVMWNIMTALTVSGSVDRSMFAALVDSGNKAICNRQANRKDYEYEDANRVMKLMLEAIHIYPPVEMFRPIDSRVAPAIEAGLFEMLLKLLIRFKDCSDNDRLLRHMGMILQSAQSVSLQQECTRAIASRRDSITAALKEYDDDGRLPVSNSWMFEDMPSMIRSMLSLNQGQEEMEGMNMAESEQLPSNKKNIYQIGTKVLGENRSRVLVDATLKGLNIVDCVVTIDLRVTPLVVDVDPAEKWFVKSEKVQQLREDAKGGIILLILQRDPERAFTKLAEDGESMIIHPSIDTAIDEKWFHELSWGEAQEKLQSHFAGRMEELKANPYLGEQYLDDVMYEYSKEIIEEAARTMYPELDELELREVMESEEFQKTVKEGLGLSLSTEDLSPVSGDEMFHSEEEAGVSVTS